jgi:hypothetical protein
MSLGGLQYGARHRDVVGRTSIWRAPQRCRWADFNMARATEMSLGGLQDGARDVVGQTPLRRVHRDVVGRTSFVVARATETALGGRHDVRSFETSTKSCGLKLLASLYWCGVAVLAVWRTRMHWTSDRTWEMHEQILTRENRRS